MAFPNNFLRHVLLWTLPGGEVAACTVHWDPDGDSLVIVGSTTQGDFSDRAHDLWEAIKVNWSNEVKFIGSRLQIVHTAGHVIATYELGDGPTDGGDSN